ncbi:MAG: UvrD-helicase domain-containing protein [Spirochaetaceae bacterium]|jgi:DNA helicase-2/ATP-dependent DNA helicase PcrA|nr:UvrD-helicase domain-containing protein [Spirochaetaceae bacterium]GMO19793.1 MAG: UvrD-helicase domain-containing protein [Termitinemataceae bacterium]
MKLNFESELNPQQALAVRSIEGPVLIIAGAGSGKTRVITYRIAYMLERGIPQHSILALTFTNKAAREMEARVKERTARKLQNLTVSTFHSFGAQILRNHIEALGWRKNFSIYDETDKIQAIKDALRECKVSAETNDISKISQLFSAIKTGIKDWDNNLDIAYKPVYEEYSRGLKVYNAVDFDDLLVLPIKLFFEHPEILEKYKERYKYIMIDEFQDTSLIQYRLMKMISGRNVCVVGDDDQSIYSWRGANYENIVNFEKDFNELLEIKLEQNYRSTTTILEAANGVISNNTSRKDKKLWTNSLNETPIELWTPENDNEEAGFIATRIKAVIHEEKRSFNDFGVLVRANHLFEKIETAFREYNIPYQVSGGQSFYARKEVKDILSYMRVIGNTDDDVNLLRIINTPKRGIGKNTITKITELANINKSSIWEAMQKMRYAEGTLFQEVAKDEFNDFMMLIEKHRAEMLGKRGLSQKLRALIEEIDYHGYLVLENGKNKNAAHYKYYNIEMLLESIEKWERDPDNFDPTLYPYLNRISLITQDKDDNTESGKANIMTIHASKGLEFPVVFIAGAENGNIPSERSLEENSSNIEEERRLFYVAITRAMNKLIITSCRKRKKQQTVVDRVPSPFLEEIPSHLISNHNPETAAPITSTSEFVLRLKKLGA